MGFDTTYTPQVQTFSLTNGGTSELMLAQDNARTALLIQPLTEATVVQFGGTAGVQATGTLTFADNPDNAETIAVNTVTFTFVTGASTATNVHIGDTATDTAVNFAAVLNASANASITVATYTADGSAVDITYDAGGTDGNAFALADSSAASVTRSAATLAGGSNGVGGIYLATNTQLALTANEFPSIKNDVYVVSATNAAKTSYLVSNG